MNDFYTVSQYARLTGKDPGNIRRMLIHGKIKGEKLGNQWIIPQNTIYPDDKRVKSGYYRNWRKRAKLWHTNPDLIKILLKMCHNLQDLYGCYLDKIVLYGSYARGEQTEESDIDIALILKNGYHENIRNTMTDIIVDYELDLGITLSVIPIDYNQYMEWNKVLPFYKNIDKDGIILWKTT